jgi:hypothetical protein
LIVNYRRARRKQPDCNAKALGIDVPTATLLRADEAIE